MTGPESELVRAAGCVLWRRSPVDDSLEICLVHRPKYDDWSHPKGKLKRGEEALEGALREVEEETGHTCAPGPRLPSVSYFTGGRPKVVHYWAAEATAGHFTPNREVDRILWLSAAAARSRVTQHPGPHPDRRVSRAARLPALTDGGPPRPGASAHRPDVTHCTRCADSAVIRP